MECAKDRDLSCGDLKAIWLHWILCLAKIWRRSWLGGRTAKVITLCRFNDFCELGVASQGMRRYLSSKHLAR